MYSIVGAADEAAALSGTDSSCRIFWRIPVTDLALLMANALAAALFIRSQRRGRLNLWPVLTVGVTMFTFTVDVSDNAWMAMLLTALALMGWMLELLLTGGKDREE